MRKAPCELQNRRRTTRVKRRSAGMALQRFQLFLRSHRLAQECTAVLFDATLDHRVLAKWLRRITPAAERQSGFFVTRGRTVTLYPTHRGTVFSRPGRCDVRRIGFYQGLV